MARSTRAIVETLEGAAHALSAFQRRIETVPLLGGLAAPDVTPTEAEPPPAPKPRRQPATRSRSSQAKDASRNAESAEAGEVLALPQPEWLFHHLSVSGPPEEILRFREAAAGPGILPWPVDYAALEEDLFLMLMHGDARQRELSAAGAHVLAARLRQVIERRNAEAAQTPRHIVAFDLHALLPVPGPVLDLGADHPRVLQWLWRHWGTTRPLRGVTMLPDDQGRADPAPIAQFRVAFWSADWTPWPAFRRLGADWPALRFEVRPRYDDD
jgi:hypothetical protein